ncbi:MAG: hypothetical protein HQL52_07890 [Magnetococcales bacterium]|nr:hypothetical protein [Magnetococcales bacterium]
MPESFNRVAFHKRLGGLIGQQNPLAWAEKIGLSKQEFTGIWTDGLTPSLEHLILIHNKTGASLDWLIFGSAKIMEENKKRAPDCLKEYGEEFLSSMHDKARSICSQDGSGDKLIPASKKELSKLTKALCPIFFRHYRRQAFEKEELRAENEAMKKRVEASEQAEEEAIEKHHCALKRAEAVAVDQRRKASARAKKDAIERRQDAVERAGGRK